MGIVFLYIFDTILITAGLSSFMPKRVTVPYCLSCVNDRYYRSMGPIIPYCHNIATNVAIFLGINWKIASYYSKLYIYFCSVYIFFVKRA